METFHRDLELGKQIEKLHLKIIQQTFPDAYIIDGYCKEWDIWIPSQKMGIEIKSDQKSRYTGNIVVEIEFNGKPSALSTTKSKYWIFYTGEKSIMVDVDDLKTLVKNFQPVIFTAKGDIKPKKAYLIPQKYIENLAITDFY